MILTVTIRDDNGAAVGALILTEKTFTSGSKGFFGQAKLEIAGKKYQTQCQLVEIGSKTDAGATGEEKAT